MYKFINIFLILIIFLSCVQKKENKQSNNATISELSEYNGVYKIINAYSHLYKQSFSGKSLREVDTEKLGMILTINNNIAIFGNQELEIQDGNGYSGQTEDNFLEYEDFLSSFVGMNYGSFDEDIIGANYVGKVKAMTMKNEIDNYYVFFADNKLIIMINAWDWEKDEKRKTEFSDLVISERHDSFFYIAEKISEHFDFDKYYIAEPENKKIWNIKDADEFRSKLPFYNYMLREWDKQNSEKMFNLNLDIDSVSNSINSYLNEYNIQSEALMDIIIDTVFLDLEEDDHASYFPLIKVSYHDILYGYFYLGYIIETNKINIAFHIPDGIETYFKKQFEISNGNLIYKN
jgi:hypothetical protein